MAQAERAEPQPAAAGPGTRPGTREIFRMICSQYRSVQITSLKDGTWLRTADPRTAPRASGTADHPGHGRRPRTRPASQTARVAAQTAGARPR